MVLESFHGTSKALTHDTWHSLFFKKKRKRFLIAYGLDGWDKLDYLKGENRGKKLGEGERKRAKNHG
jgi:hypothetical protein